MEYNKIYKNNKDVWGKKPNKLLRIAWEKVQSGSWFLDLGCGQGRDSLFMAKKNFKVVAVDISNEGIKSVKLIAEKNNLDINAICKNIKDFKIENNKYSIINIFDSLHFLSRKEALKLIGKIKTKLKQNGLMIISDFTTQDILFKKERNKNKAFFCPKELLKLFSDFNIILYKEYSVNDPGHLGFEEPHSHQIVELIAQKIKNRENNSLD